MDIAIKLIKSLKDIFERKLGLIFDNKETVLELNGCTIEAYPSNHFDAYRALENPKFILLTKAISSVSQNRKTLGLSLSGTLVKVTPTS